MNKTTGSTDLTKDSSQFAETTSVYLIVKRMAVAVLCRTQQELQEMAKDPLTAEYLLEIVDSFQSWIRKVPLKELVLLDTAISKITHTLEGMNWGIDEELDALVNQG